MRRKGKLVLICSSALLVPVVVIGLVFTDTRFARWIHDDGGQTPESLLERAIPAWNLDASRFRYAGVQSTSGGLIVHRWEHQDERQAEAIDITPVEGLVCYSKRDNNSGQFRNIGCVRYPG